MQVGTPDTGGKERVTGKEEGMVEQVAGTLRRVSRCTQCGQHQPRGRERVAIAHGCEGERYALLLRQQEHPSAPSGELPRTRRMIAANVGHAAPRDLPPLL